jgi:hypothetical protein
MPEHAIIPEFSSIAWSYDAWGPFKDPITTVTIHRDSNGNMIIYDIPHELRNDAPDDIQHILAQRKYLGVSKMHSRIMLTVKTNHY